MLQGTRIDNIINKTDIFPMMPGNEKFSNISSRLRQFEELATSHEQNARGRLAEDTLWRTLIFDTAEDCRPALSDFETCYHEMRHFIGNYPTAEDEEIYAWYGAYVGKFLMEVASRCQRRRLAITAENRVGLMPETARPGGLIAVFDGWVRLCCVRISGVAFVSLAIVTSMV